jgi:hypothetical protein
VKGEFAESVAPPQRNAILASEVKMKIGKLNLGRAPDFAGLMSATILLVSVIATPAFGGPVVFSNGNVTNQMAVASRPSSSSFEIESADDFVLSSSTALNHLTFTGLLTGGATKADISQVVTEFYRVFPKDSNTGGVPNVPTRTNSPSDVALTDRDSAVGGLSFAATILSNDFTAANSVQPGGIHAAPNQTTRGNGPVSGIEVLIDVLFSSSINLDADHYFFVPQVALGKGDFYWLSSQRPIVAPGTPFLPDLQGWTRDAQLEPDWLRVGTDIVGGNPPPTFNFAFTIDGEAAAVPEPSILALVFLAMAAATGTKRTTRGKIQSI